MNNSKEHENAMSFRRHIIGPPMGIGDLGRMAIYFQGAGKHWYYFQGFGEQAHSFGDLGSPAKK